MPANRQILLQSRPTGMPTPENFALVERPIPEPGTGEVLVRNRLLSVDPYMRGRMNDVKSYTPPFQLGEPVEHRGVVVTPLFPRHDPVAAYVTLDEALPRGLRITETSDAGSVPELFVENPTGDAVLLYDGEELVGAKQNRILNVSVLVGAGAKLPIPVSCVEQGRWSQLSDKFSAAPHLSDAHLRRRKAEMLLRWRARRAARVVKPNASDKRRLSEAESACLGRNSGRTFVSGQATILEAGAAL